MEPVEFDGPAKLICVKYTGPIVTVSAKDMYSAWKRWVTDGNAQYQPAFANSVGGDELGGGVSLAGYFFVRNDLGWRITHEDFDQEIRLTGDLYPVDPAVIMFDPEPDSYGVQFVLQRSSATQVVTVDSGTVTPSPQEIRDAMTLPATASVNAGSIDDKLATVNEGVKNASLLVPHTTNL